MEEDCPNKTIYSNYQENHLAFSKIYNIYKRTREIMKVKYKRNIIFLEVKKNKGILCKSENLYQCNLEGESSQLQHYHHHHQQQQQSTW